MRNRDRTSYPRASEGLDQLAQQNIVLINLMLILAVNITTPQIQQDLRISMDSPAALPQMPPQPW